MQSRTYNEILNKIKEFNFIVIDNKIIELYPEIKNLLPNKRAYVLNNPEKNKSMQVYEEICTSFLNQRISRGDKVLAIGGGATSDLAGFVAATILRGIEWEVIPTTLLAMIDASIGGKVGINTDGGKNLIGAFHQPRSVHICTDFLKTLSATELDSGKGELLKYAFLNSEIGQKVLEHGFDQRITDQEIIIDCASYKEKVVKDDFNDLGQRKILNLGHSFGHAIEKTLRIPHGIAVNCGLELIIKLYHPDMLALLVRLQEKLGLEQYKIKGINFKDFSNYLAMDKKRIDLNTIELILLSEVGEPRIEKKLVSDIIRELQNHEIYHSYFQ